MTTALLNPGAMGAAIGRELRAADPNREVLWVGAGRSPDTRDRAVAAGLTEVGSLADVVAAADVVLSVCPPANALDVARAVADAGFSGRYVDANAVSPTTARAVAELFDDAVDGGIVGPPPSQPSTTRLYVSGPSASSVAELFTGSNLEVRLVDGGAGAASAVKMCFAGWTKGTAAILLAIRALAQAEGVEDALLGEWATSMPELVTRSEVAPAGIGPKAWRFEPELQEIAASMRAAGLPGGFHEAGADIYERMAGFKGRPESGDETVTLAEVLEALLSR